MKKTLLGLLLMIAIMSLMFFMNDVQSFYTVEKEKAAEKKIQEKLVIAHTEIFGKLERPQVVFDHGRHAGAFKKEGCNTCHPLATDGNHIFDFPFKAANKTAKEIEDLYHEKCISCHKNIIKEKKKSLPIRCGDCHVKKFESFTIKYPVFEFDFAYHNKHVKKLQNKCILCHHIYNEELVYEECTEQSCYYCHGEQKKRGPTLAVETDITQKKGLSIRKVSHSRCINCHLDNLKTANKSGPIECIKCHTGKYRTMAELESIPMPNRDQPKKPFISIEDGKMKGVLFDHAIHEKNSKTCRACHHETLNACKKCHGLTGSPEGRWINIANAFHDVFAESSCAGCHMKKKSGKDCAGCHHHLLDMDPQVKGPKKTFCAVCHSGRKETSHVTKPIAVSTLDAEKVPENVTIKVLEKQYKPSTFPHRKIIRKLIEISNESKMATYFHRNIQTVCRGCHHQSIAEAEAKDTDPPFCRNCHSITFDTKNMNRPRLLAAYHRQCLGCHEKMGIKPTGCTDCHKEKAEQPVDILFKTTDSKTLLTEKGK